ncbi:MAG: hypothetical protein KGH91_01750 [Rhodospirillales bacterium]|nr:hypothetical protein [Rhodospirillales bacterium]
MFKLGHFVDGVWSQYSHPAIFSVERNQTNESKLLATAPRSDPAIFRALVNGLNPHLFLLYVLHTPRGEGKAGRYQSNSIDHADFANFLSCFEDFFQSDSRFDLWAHSPADRATIVWDRHDLIHVYGIVEHAVTALRGLGFQQGCPIINFVHQHYYHHENDERAAQLLTAFDWNWSPLRSEDEQ